MKEPKENNLAFIDGQNLLLLCIKIWP